MSKEKEAAELRAKAARYRGLARQSNDDRTAMEIFRLAEQIEQQADNLAKGKRGRAFHLSSILKLRDWVREKATSEQKLARYRRRASEFDNANTNKSLRRLVDELEKHIRDLRR
jgi:hypothetical protein